MNDAPHFHEEPIMLRDTQQQDRVLERPPFWVRYRWHGIVLGVLIAAAVALGATLLRFNGARTSVERSRVTIATVTRGSFVRDVVADGQVVAAVSPTLYAASPGNVTLKIHAGDAVNEGDVVAVIDSPDLSAKLSQEEATLQSALLDWRRARLEADRKLAQVRDTLQQAEIDQKTSQREADRSRKAYELGSYSELQAQRSQDAYEKARFAYEQAKANFESQPEQNRFDVDSRKALLDRQQFLVTELRRQVEGLQVRSPVTGQIGQVRVDDRASVAKDAPLLTVVDLSALETEIKVPESLARDLAVGMSADLDGGARHWKGTVSGVSPQVVNGEVTARVRFADEKTDGLRQNQRLSVRIFIDKRDNVLMVDRGLFVDQDGGGFIYEVHDNIAERRPVTLGAVGVQKVEILEGVAEGAQVVISGTDAFRSADRVILSN